MRLKRMMKKVTVKVIATGIVDNEPWVSCSIPSWAVSKLPFRVRVHYTQHGTSVFDIPEKKLSVLNLLTFEYETV